MRHSYKLLLIICFSVTVFADVEKTPFVAKEEIDYVSREQNDLLGLNKVKEFRGVIWRAKDSPSLAKEIDVYYFKDLTALKSDQRLCSKIADRIFGPEKEITLKRTSMKMIPSASAGKICSLVVTDPGSQAMIKERHLMVKILHAKVYAFVVRFTKAAGPEEIQDARQFIEGLR